MTRLLETYPLGKSASFTKTITDADIVLYAGLTGDLNPVHINDVAAAQSPFKQRIAHGMLTMGLVSAVLGMQLPGPGTIYLKQDIRFTAPVYIGDTVTATVRVDQVLAEKGRLVLTTTCANQKGDQVLTGTATVVPPTLQT